MTFFSSCTTYSPAPRISHRKSKRRRMILPGKKPSDLNRLDLVETLQVPSPQANPILRLDLPLTPTTGINTTIPIKGTFLMMVRDATSACLTSDVTFLRVQTLYQIYKSNNKRSRLCCSTTEKSCSFISIPKSQLSPDSD